MRRGYLGSGSAVQGWPGRGVGTSWGSGRWGFGLWEMDCEISVIQKF